MMPGGVVRLRAGLLMVLLLAACSQPAGTPLARAYVDPPADEMTALLELQTRAATESLSVAVYDHPDIDCGGRQGYQGFRKTRGRSESMRIPAGRFVQLAPLYDDSGAMCLDFVRLGLTPEPGGIYRMHYEHQRVPCTPDFNAKADDRRACQPYAPFREICGVVLEQKTAAGWARAQNVVQRPGYNSHCQRQD